MPFTQNHKVLKAYTSHHHQHELKAATLHPNSTLLMEQRVGPQLRGPSFLADPGIIWDMFFSVLGVKQNKSVSGTVLLLTLSAGSFECSLTASGGASQTQAKLGALPCYRKDCGTSHCEEEFEFIFFKGQTFCVCVGGWGVLFHFVLCETVLGTRVWPPQEEFCFVVFLLTTYRIGGLLKLLPSKSC